ncbi:hypothetical protein BMS3Abin11_02582 [bacterium BMS3Abin11]|nr:hypothetical protein BMS3Abin11_02582 [bacterium BMS3Abin11]
MNIQGKGALQGVIEILSKDARYNRKAKWLRSLEYIKALLLSYLKSTIIWFPTRGLMPIAMGDWLIHFFRLEAA